MHPGCSRVDKSRRALFLKSHLRYFRSMYIQYYLHVSLLSSSPSVAAEICGSSCQVDEKSECVMCVGGGRELFGRRLLFHSRSLGLDAILE